MAIREVVLRIDPEELDFAISDLLCYWKGFKDAKGDDWDNFLNEPIDELRVFRAELKRHLS